MRDRAGEVTLSFEIAVARSAASVSRLFGWTVGRPPPAGTTRPPVPPGEPSPEPGGPSPEPGGPSPGHPTGLWAMLWPQLKPYRWLLVTAFVLNAAHGVAIVFQTVTPKYLIDNVMLPPGLTSAVRWHRLLWLAAGYFLASVVARMLVWHVGFRMFTYVRERALFGLRAQFFRHVNHLCLRFHVRNHSGELFNYLFGNPLQQVQAYFQQLAFGAAGSLVVLVTTVVWLGAWDWVLTGILLGTVGRHRGPDGPHPPQDAGHGRRLPEGREQRDRVRGRPAPRQPGREAVRHGGPGRRRVRRAGVGGRPQDVRAGGEGPRPVDAAGDAGLLRLRRPVRRLRVAVLQRPPDRRPGPRRTWPPSWGCRRR